MRELMICRRLLEQADDLRFENPSEAFRMAETVRRRAARLRKDQVGEAEWLDLQADVWAVMGSALRSISDPMEAEGALNVALAFLEASKIAAHFNPLKHARLAQRAAYVRCDQRRFEEALNLIDEAIEAFTDGGAAQAAAGALADRGLILGRSGRQDEAIRHLGEALDQLDPDQSQRNFTAAIHNTALYLHDLADDSPWTHDLALKWLHLAQRCHQALPPGSLNSLKLRTLLALTSIRLGHDEEGIHELWQAQEGFQQLGAVYEQSLALLHLATSYLIRGQREEVRRVSGRLFPIFRGLKSDREASAALMLFYDTAQAETATLDLIDQVSATLRRARGRRPRPTNRS